MDSIFANVSLTHSSRFSEHESFGENALDLARPEAQRVTNSNIAKNRKTIEELVISELQNGQRFCLAQCRLRLNLWSCLKGPD